MTLRIRNPEARELAGALARLTGESLSKAVTEVIRERLEREQQRRDKEAMVAEAMAIACHCASYPRRSDSSLEEFLYDKRGLPPSDR
jgi:antitoxin VapB